MSGHTHDATPLTPMMAQYIEIKAAHPDYLLFYRMGDFYELFFEDAENASRVLGIILTKRGKHLGQDIPMCGVPVDRASEYLERLISGGYCVAVCEQTEDAETAKKRGGKTLIARSVVRLITPGTLTEDNLLEPGRANTLCALGCVITKGGATRYGVASLDLSTGQFYVKEVDHITALTSEIARLEPREILVPEALYSDRQLIALWREGGAHIVPSQTASSMTPQRGYQTLCRAYNVASLDSFGDFSDAEVVAAAIAYAYLEYTQRSTQPVLTFPKRETMHDVLILDRATRRSLELTTTQDGLIKGSLCHVMDRTLTAGGRRLLAERLSAPSTRLSIIRKRQEAIGVFVRDSINRLHIQRVLKHMPDLHRVLTRLCLGRGGPRDCVLLARGLQDITRLNALLPHGTCEEIEHLRHNFDELAPSLGQELQAAFADDVPVIKRDGGFIREGYDSELDDVRLLQSDARRVIAALQARYVQETLCRSLRVKYNRILGYFVEVPQPLSAPFLEGPLNAQFIHRQTMADALRFTTCELGDLDQKITRASENALSRELALFDMCLEKIRDHAETIRHAAEAVCILDVTTALAALAEEEKWVCPIVDDSLTFHIEGGRHPQVEAALKEEGKPFIPNHCILAKPTDEEGDLLILTGPNMGGKSTYLRQNAVMVILSQMGSWVPAKSAHIGCVDRLYSRVGASDDLARGRSTFMVEMIETATILNQTTNRSLVILDEIGRGTSTLDGLSIAWATAEHLHNTVRCRGLFATHFHELTALEKQLDRVKNATVRVSAWENDLIFLHEIVPGVADRSYGLYVARRAGLPESVIVRASHILEELEKSEHEKSLMVF
jgi:DNA mismatch repair protein MutS